MLKELQKSLNTEVVDTHVLSNQEEVLDAKSDEVFQKTTDDRYIVTMYIDGKM